MTYRVRITLKAVEDVDETVNWIVQHSVSGGQKWLQRFIDAVDSLEEHPKRCALAPESSFVDRKVRQLMVGKRINAYRVLFEIVESHNEVIILRVLHGLRHTLTEPDEL